MALDATQASFQISIGEPWVTLRADGSLVEYSGTRASAAKIAAAKSDWTVARVTVPVDAVVLADEMAQTDPKFWTF